MTFAASKPLAIRNSPSSQHDSSRSDAEESQSNQDAYPAEIDFGPDPRIIIFYISLPDPVALPGATTFSQFFDESVAELENAPISLTPDDEPLPEEVSGKLFVSLRFWQTSERHQSDAVVLDVPWDVLRRTLPMEALPHRPLIARFRTVARQLSERLRPPLKPVTVMEAVTVLQPTDEHPTKEAFERCLALATEVIRSYRLSQRLMTRYPTVERLPFLVPYMVRTLTIPTAWEGPFMYLLHYNTPSAHEFELPGPEEMDRLGFFFEAIRNGNPMVTYSDQRMEARIAFRRAGDYPNAVIHAQTSLEALFDNLLTLLFWEEGFDPARAAVEEFSLEMTLHRRIQRNFPKRVGGNWNPDGTGPIAKWRTSVVKLRNRVVHAAYIPSRAEAEEALKVSSDVSQFVFQCLAGAIDRFPKSALLTIGLEGIGTFRSLTQDIRDVAASDDGDWLHQYGAWRQTFEESINWQS